ncbi:hypothetical protein [Gilliamella apis]|uniref:hypothetical protein n=1 Tax=Gilliamella apis TaxID=1970738 RepID=UPI00080DA0F6|nr:hypothetical protein [Gilliamella apis]OCG05997.1 hypothetical protein A9G19_01420 [Gilliamella apis]
MVVLQSISFTNYALTTTTTNIIYGSAPYLTFDGGRTRVTNTAALLGISLSDGRRFTPTTNNSERNPIVLPVVGQSFNDIGMLVPRDTDSIALSSLIGTPYNYWGDDDGDGQGIDGITATGSLKLSIVDKLDRAVARNEVLDICKAPYKLTLSNSEGILTTRYGVPNESYFTSGNATYYINPNPNISSSVICVAKPLEVDNSFIFPPPINTWDRSKKGFLTQSVTPSSYGSNFPTTGANGLYFDLDIGGNNQALSWEPVSHEGITATITNSIYQSVRVTLTGPIARNSLTNPGRVRIPSLPQSFELVGRDSSGNAVVKYGFVLKQWFINLDLGSRSNASFNDASSWCNKTGYRLPKVRDLTNAPSCSRSCGRYENEFPGGATPSSPDGYSRRHIGAGLFAEWGPPAYSLFGSNRIYYSSELTNDGNYVFSVVLPEGSSTVSRRMNNIYAYGYSMLCTRP